MPDESNNKKTVSLNLFVSLYLLVFTVILAVVGWFGEAVSGQYKEIDKNRDNISEVKGDIKAINTNIANISQLLNEIKNDLKKK